MNREPDQPGWMFEFSSDGVVYRIYRGEDRRLWVRRFLWSDEALGYVGSDEPEQLSGADLDELIEILSV